MTIVQTQAITFANPGTQTVGTPLTLLATSTSGLPVSFASTTSSVCTVTGNTATFLASGSCTIQATQAGNSTYAPAPAVQQTFAVNGAVTVFPSSYQFANYLSAGSSSAPASFTLSNSETTALTISNIQISNSHFSQTNTCGNGLAPGTGCIISVTFTPQSYGELNATLTVSDSDGSSPQTVKLSGFGIGAFTVLPKVYSFPNSQADGTKSAPVSFTVSNSEATTVAISAITLSNPQFSQTNTCGSSLAPGASCTILVSFTPTILGKTSAVLSVASDQAGSPQTAEIAGFGSGALAFSPSSLTFPPHIVGRPSAPRTIAVTNTQPVPVTITSIGSTGSAFTVTNNCIPSGSTSGVLAPGVGCSIGVAFDPAVTGSVSGSVSIANSAAGSPETLELNGNGEVDLNGVYFTVLPQPSCILTGGTEQFMAQLQNGSNAAVTWYADGVANGNGQSGNISSQGLYVAPSAAGKHTVKAISQANPSVTSSVTFDVTTAASVGIFPANSSIPTSSQQVFQGQICSQPDSNVTWSVDNIPNGSSTAGTIDVNGVYTAPAAAGQHTIQMTDTNLNISSTATVTIYPSILVDFGLRSNTQYPIRQGIMGTNTPTAVLDANDAGLVTEAGITTTRASAYLDQIFATPNPDWSQFDPQMEFLQASGMQTILILYKTPLWLQPTPNPCSVVNDSDVLPAFNSIWAQMAAAVVAHVDAYFPGVVTDYEIWNEPDGQLCGSTALEGYLALYAAAAPAVKQQAAADGVTVRVGGPGGGTTGWISSLLSNPATAPYVDFVSYHNYVGQPSSAWDSYDGTHSLYQATQQGQPANYVEVFNMVAAGSQPGGASTPIYIDEYNFSSASVQSCCRNDPVYAPVWNALYVSDVLDAAYSAHAQVPAEFGYFAASYYPYFCVIGTWDSSMDCQYDPGGFAAPYPQYYAYQLIGAHPYLDLDSGGYMAASVSPGDGGGGPVVTAFYTPSQDSILIVNPTSISYTHIPITVENAGFSLPAATLYQLGSPVPESGVAIHATSLGLTQSGTAYTATISIPPYSVMGISIK